MDLPLDDRLRIGVQTIHRRTEPAVGPWLPTIDEMRTLVELVDRCGYDLLWVGDHISFTLAIFDPLLQLAQAAVVSRRLHLGTAVYLLPLRHPTPVAKQVSTLDHLTEGRFIFGVGVGGEFPKEYEACGVPIGERGARLSESFAVLRKLWSGEPASHDGRFFKFEEVPMQPPPRQPGGPPIWCGGRSDAALRRIGRMTDGWMSYVVTPDMFRQGLEKIAAAAANAAVPSTAASAPPISSSRASTTPTKRRSTPRRSRSASATPWISARPPSATARSARRSRSSRPSIASMRRAPVTSSSTSSALTSSATGRSSASPREAMPLLADLRERWR